ncbi:MAG: phage/plasmid primase, P4 family, partial [Cyanobacteriota bacterium]|nr:phage/plasmid primase, P4 family [Cyanobacteriota bacterium]
EAEGIWSLVSEKYMAAEIDRILEARNIEGYGTNSYIKNIIASLERRLYLREWFEKPSTEWLPFQNGVLNLATGSLHEHSPEFRLTWQLPRDYTIVSSGYSAIDNWLTEATGGNAEYKELLLCFAAAVLRGRNDLQKFLHLIGGGGSGKSTFTTLLTALIGEENTATLNMSDLEDKHEIARIFGKRLVVLPDQDKAPKKMSNFKRLTGQDRLSGRRLYENGMEFVFGGLTVVTSNFPIFHTNVGSWLTRRVKMIPFDYQCPAHKKRDLMQEFSPELSAFTSYLLSIPSEKIDRVLKGVSDRAIDPTVWESQIRSDGMAAWVNDWVVQDCTAITRIGSNKSEWSSETEYEGSRSTLYGSYALYCQQTNRSAKSPQNFSAELIELCTRILGWQVEKDRVKMAGQTVRVIKGIRLRSHLDGDKPTVEEILEKSKVKSQKSKVIQQNINLKDKKLLLSNSSKLKYLMFKLSDIKLLTFDLLVLTLSEAMGDNGGDNPGDKVKALADKGIEQGDKRSAIKGEEKIKSNSSNKNQTVAQKQINWATYPHDSRSLRRKKERADQVKAKILGCSTSNELIELKISSRETDWLKKNVLNQAEKEQIKEIEMTRQGNLLSFDATEQVVYFDFNEVMKAIDEEMRRLNWSRGEGKDYLMKTYGVKSRLKLNDGQLIEFWNYLKQQ